MPATLAILLALSGASTRNPSDCLALPVDQQTACVQAIRAGRHVEIQGLDTVRAAPVEAFSRAPYEEPKLSLEERRTIAEESTAWGVKTIAVIDIIGVSVAAVFLIISGFKH